MRLFLLFLTSLLLPAAPVAGQIFFAQGGPIADFAGQDVATRFPVEVRALPAHLTGTFGLEGACLSITHPLTADLKIELLSPAGTSIWLSNRNGAEGYDYAGTCFRMEGFNGYVYEGKSPFTGTYIPDGKLQFFNDGQNPNGTWYLLVHDLAAGRAGSVTQLSLTFGPHPAPPDYAPCNPRSPAACACPDGSANCDLLPDLIVSEKILRDLHQEYGPADPTYPRQVRLAVGTANIGWGPLETHGTGRWHCPNGQTAAGASTPCPGGQAPQQAIEQVIYQRRGDQLLKRTRPAGINYYDPRPGHNHYHADDWVDFTLRRRRKNQPDPRRWPVIGRGTKASYCLFDSGNCGDADGVCQNGRGQTVGRSQLPNAGLGHYVGCDALTQGISVGGIDLYGISFEGQAVPIPKGTRNGEYYLVVEVDPQNLFEESDETNNVVAIPITLSKQETGK